ncbi:MAG: hypothetical protein MI802_24770 [Desulfobacterales bacterium]|nr:hypothetical protein [Desulfobacterales bacterium]
MLRQTIAIAIAITGLLLVSQPAAAGKWSTLKTKYLSVHYQDTADLKTFDRKIKPVKHTGGFSSFSAGNSQSSGQFGRLSAKLDTLCEKVQLILDMRKPIRVNVRIYSDKAALDEAYYKIYKKKKSLRAWYLFRYNTIYLQAGDVFAGMLAHEIAHAVVDHYLDVRPPRATAEILARYVDAHLNEEAKTY